VLALIVNPEHPEPRKIAQAVEVIQRGGVALYPTDTVYALGCALDDKKAVDRIRQLKRMDEKHQLAMICPDLSDIARYALVSNAAYRIMKRIFPGPYTVILEATHEVPRLLLDKRRTVGIRVPESPICEALVRALGKPLLTSSAVAPDAEGPCTDVAEGKAAFGRGLDVSIDGGDLPGQVSTVISLVGDEVEIIREGLGPLEPITG
jgi:tRNA threonylcarbamoyl adenosine modification protein (Sua5/YciO/YrdC/YwlC family)